MYILEVSVEQTLVNRLGFFQNTFDCTEWVITSKYTKLQFQIEHAV